MVELIIGNYSIKNNNIEFFKMLRNKIDYSEREVFRIRNIYLMRLLKKLCKIIIKYIKVFVR